MPLQLRYATDMKDLLTHTGNAVRSEKDGSVRGWLVPFGSPTDLDAYGTFFHAETDFGTAERTAVLYEHGFDPDIGRRSFDEGATLDIREKGVFVEGKLDLSDPVAARMLRFVDQQMLSWSSGTAPHLVDAVELESGAVRIDRWPLGLDASLTHSPANNKAEAMRSIRKAATPQTRYFFGATVSNRLRSISEEIQQRRIAHRLESLNNSFGESNGR